MDEQINSCSENMDAVFLNQNDPVQHLIIGNYQFSFAFEPLDNFANKKNLIEDPSFSTGALIIMTNTDEYIIAGSGVIVTFSAVNDDKNMKAGIDSDEKGHFKAGKWSCLLRCNGDHTHQGRHVRLENNKFSIHKIKLYQYK